MASLAKYLSDIVGKAFAVQGLSEALGVVRVSDRPDLAQFQCNGAMAAAKQAGKNPREVAQAILNCLQDPGFPATPDELRRTGRRESSVGDIFEKLEIAGPGFININLKKDFFSKYLSENSQFDVGGIGKGQTVVLDYGGPNVAKPMHVGHLRSSIIGDSMRRIYLAAGYKAIGDVHLGDWGTQMGQVISELEIRGRLDKPVTMEELEEIYPAASKACKEDEARAEMARAATVKLQNGDAAYRKVWRNMVDVSIESMKKNFESMGVQFDLWKGEASVHDLIAPMVADLKSRGIAVESDGALVVNVAREDDKKEIPPLILYKRDGAVMYGTTDLATIVDRMNENKPVKMIYIVDQRQNLHFEQVFRAARVAKLAPESAELTFAGFGTMNGTDGKPFKTRAGGVMKLEDLIEMGREKARARLAEADLAKDMSAEAREDVAQAIALAALKFADLQNNRIADYVFDLDRMTSFEGKTGPYLLYQAVRIQSLLAKAQDKFENAAIVLGDADRGLALMLCEYPDHFENALRNNTPHVLCDYVYKLAQEFSSFYGSCHILSESDEGLRRSRLRLCALTRERIEAVLALLGIQIPEKM